jgi:hypothetical protein
MPDLSQVVMCFSGHPSYVAVNVQGPLTDEDLGLIWLDWVRKLNGAMLAGYDLVLLIPQKTAIAPEVLAPWRSVKRFNENTGVASWPRGPNLVFQQIQWFYYHEKLRGPFLWCEPDCVPVAADWLDRIRQQYAACGKDFLGAMVEHIVINNGQRVPRHMTGNAVYPHKAYEKAPKIMEAVTTGWDVQAADQILPKAHITGLIQHEFRHAQFTTREELEKTLKPGVVLFHADKYGAIPRLLSGAPGEKQQIRLIEPRPVDPRDGLKQEPAMVTYHAEEQKHGLEWYTMMEILDYVKAQADKSPEAHEYILSFLDGWKAELRQRKAMDDFQKLMTKSNDALATLTG